MANTHEYTIKVFEIIDLRRNFLLIKIFTIWNHLETVIKNGFHFLYCKKTDCQGLNEENITVNIVNRILACLFPNYSSTV